MVCPADLRPPESGLALDFCRPQGVCEIFQMSENGSFIASGVVVLVHQFLKPAMNDLATEFLSLNRFGEADMTAPKRLFLGYVVKSSF
jgi:hypothetical protein